MEEGGGFNDLPSFPILSQEVSLFPGPGALCSVCLLGDLVTPRRTLSLVMYSTMGDPRSIKQARPRKTAWASIWLRNMHKTRVQYALNIF